MRIEAKDREFFKQQNLSTLKLATSTNTISNLEKNKEKSKKARSLSKPKKNTIWKYNITDLEINIIFTYKKE